MVISESSLVFLQGFLSSLSLITKETNKDTVTSVLLKTPYESMEKNLLLFYDFLKNENIDSKCKVTFITFQKALMMNFFHSQSLLNQLSNERKEYIEYQFIENLSYCYENFESIQFLNLEITKINASFENLVVEFFIFPSVTKQALMFSIWKGNDNPSNS